MIHDNHKGRSIRPACNQGHKFNQLIRKLKKVNLLMVHPYETYLCCLSLPCPHAGQVDGCCYLNVYPA